MDENERIVTDLQALEPLIPDERKTEFKALIATLQAQVDEQHNAAPEQSTHYRAVIEPFLKRLEKIKTISTGARPPQIGDAELTALLNA